MPKGVAVWLIENTSLAFEQIADFCDLHPIEVQGIADGEVSRGTIGVDPIVMNQLTREEITRCENDPAARLQLTSEIKEILKEEAKANKKSKYIPIARRQDKSNAIMWLLKEASELSDLQICKLICTTKNMIEKIRDKSYWKYKALTPKDPVLLGLCTQVELDRVYNSALKRLEKSKDFVSDDKKN